MANEGSCLDTTLSRECPTRNGEGAARVFVQCSCKPSTLADALTLGANSEVAASDDFMWLPRPRSNFANRPRFSRGLN